MKLIAFLKSKVTKLKSHRLDDVKKKTPSATVVFNPIEFEPGEESSERWVKVEKPQDHSCGQSPTTSSNSQHQHNTSSPQMGGSLASCCCTTWKNYQPNQNKRKKSKSRRKKTPHVGTPLVRSIENSPVEIVEIPETSSSRKKSSSPSTPSTSSRISPKIARTPSSSSHTSSPKQSQSSSSPKVENNTSSSQTSSLTSSNHNETSSQENGGGKNSTADLEQQMANLTLLHPNGGLHTPASKKADDASKEPARNVQKVEEPEQPSRRIDPERPFRCDQCGNQFAYKRSLNRHIRTIHGTGYKQCPLCIGVTFSQKVSYQKHLTSQKHLKKIWDTLYEHDSSLKRVNFLQDGTNKYVRSKLMTAWKEKGFSLTEKPASPSKQKNNQKQNNVDHLQTTDAQHQYHPSSSPNSPGTSPSMSPYLNTNYDSCPSFSRDTSPEPESGRFDGFMEQQHQVGGQQQHQHQVGPFKNDFGGARIVDPSSFLMSDSEPVHHVKQEDGFPSLISPSESSHDNQQLFIKTEGDVEQVHGGRRSSTSTFQPLRDPLSSDSLPLPSPKHDTLMQHHQHQQQNIKKEFMEDGVSNGFHPCEFCGRDTFIDVDDYVQHMQTHGDNSEFCGEPFDERIVDSFFRRDSLEQMKTEHIVSLPSPAIQDPQMISFSDIFDGKIDDIEPELNSIAKQYGRGEFSVDPVAVNEKFEIEKLIDLNEQYSRSEIECADSFLRVDS